MRFHRRLVESGFVLSEVEAVIARFQARAGDLAGQRARYDEMADDLPLPSGLSVGDVSLGRIAAECVVASGARIDAAVLFFHGGGYVVGSPRAYRGLAAILGGETGIQTIAVRYRLAPEHPFPAAVDDTTAAYRALLDSGMPADRIVFAGDSAGGGLVLATLIRARDEGLPMPAAGYGMSPWLDLAGEGASFTENGECDRLMTPEGALGCAAAYLQGQDARHPWASPVHADLAGLPPLLLQVGSTELFLDDATRLARRGGLAGVHVELQIWPGMPHVWQRFAPVLAEGREALASAGRFLGSRLGSGRT